MSKKVSFSFIVFVLALTILACQVSGLVPTSTPLPTPTTSSAVAPAQAVTLSNEQDQLVSLFQTVSPGVVTILAGNALGSGWVYNMDGYIVTNAHVVGSETKVEVDFPNGFKVYGNVAGSDQNSDLAVVKVTVAPDELHPLALGDSDTLKVGQIVAAIGDPLALNGTTLTTGVVAGLGRTEDSNNQTSGGAYFAAGDFIETDALLNHGNSGGPLLNLAGQVVGVNRSIQIDTSSGVPSGLGYAISVNVVKRVIPQLIQKGKFDYPYLGISFLPNGLTLDVISALGLKSTTGAYITDITAGGPAEKAGLIAGTKSSSIQGLNSGGDLIVAVDGQPVQEFNDLMRYIVVHKGPGETINLTVLRGDQKLDVKLTLGVRP